MSAPTVEDYNRLAADLSRLRRKVARIKTIGTDKWQGRRVSSADPSDADVAKWNATTRQFEYEAPSTAVAHTLDSAHHTDVTSITEAQGQVLFVNSAGGLVWDALSPGTNGFFLMTGGAGANPSWVAALKADGSVALTGNLSVDAGVTIDGADIGAHVASYDGSFIEPFTFAVTSNGSTITGTLDKNPSGDLTERFSDGYSTVSSGGTVSLIEGGDTAPKKNYIYILQSNKGVLVASDSGWPAAEHISIAEVIVQSASRVQTEGPLVSRFWNDFAKGTDGQGHHLHAWARLRFEHSAWKSGVAITWTIDSIPSPDTVHLRLTAGKVYQLHLQGVEEKNTATGDNVHVVNDFTTPYTTITDFADLLTDNQNSSMSGKYFNLVVWSSVSSGSENEHLFVNLPSGSYNKQGDAIADVSGFTVFDIPSDFRGKAFLVSRITLRHQSAGGGTWTSIQQTDLRGQVPNIVAGGGTAAITTEFADSQFRIFDEGDPTALLAFQLSGISASTTRTVTIPDEDVTLHPTAHGPSQHTEGSAWKVIYQDENGDEVEIGFGGDGKVFTSGGDSTQPNFEDASAHGDHLPAASIAETDTGTEAAKSVTPDGLQGSIRNIRFITIRLIAADTDVDAATDIGGVRAWVCPFAGTLLQDDSNKEFCSASVDVAGVGGTMVIDVHKGGTTVMDTNKLDIETTEVTTTTATTQPDLTVTAVAAGDVFTFDVDTEHSTTEAKGLSVTLAIRMT